MITAKMLRNMMLAKPFKPFRIVMTDGRTFDVPHHDAAFVEQNTLDVGINLNADGIAEDIARCAILHIVRVEDMPASAKAA